MTTQTANRAGVAKGVGSRDSRNGRGEKTAFAENQEAVVHVPRYRNGAFEPRALPKGWKRVSPLNDQTLSARPFGMTSRDIKSRLEWVCDVEARPD
jgi:transposase-like protein